MKLIKTGIVLLIFGASFAFFSTRSYPIQSVMALLMEKFHQHYDIIDIQGNKLVLIDEISELFFETNSQDKVILKNTDKIVEELVQFPLIKQVRVKRYSPSKVAIIITERSPLLFYYDANFNTVMVENDFDEFYDKRVPLESLIFVRGAYKKQKIQNFLKILQKYPSIYENLTEIEHFLGYRFNIVLNNKVQVLLPESDKRLPVELEYLTRIIHQRNILHKGISEIDLRDASKIYISARNRYQPPSNRVVLYKTPTEDAKYEQVINNAIAKI